MSDHSSNARAKAQPKRSLTWRPIDIVIVAILGVATGFIFVVWNNIGYAWFTAMDNLTPGLGGLAVGIWLLGGVLGGLIIRKPGAAIFVEVFAASGFAMGTGNPLFRSGTGVGCGINLPYLCLSQV